MFLKLGFILVVMVSKSTNSGICYNPIPLHTRDLIHMWSVQRVWGVRDPLQDLCAYGSMKEYQLYHNNQRMPYILVTYLHNMLVMSSPQLPRAPISHEISHSLLYSESVIHSAHMFDRF